MPEMTPLQNNPPQSLAQPMRQAYDYWQEVPCHKRKKPKKASLKLSTTQERICKAPCAWRAPPPSRGSSPLLPVSGASWLVSRSQQLNSLSAAKQVANWQEAL